MMILANAWFYSNVNKQFEWIATESDSSLRWYSHIFIVAHRPWKVSKENELNRFQDSLFVTCICQQISSGSAYDVTNQIAEQTGGTKYVFLMGFIIMLPTEKFRRQVNWLVEQKLYNQSYSFLMSFLIKWLYVASLFGVSKKVEQNAAWDNWVLMQSSNKSSIIDVYIQVSNLLEERLTKNCSWLPLSLMILQTVQRCIAVSKALEQSDDRIYLVVTW
jgi:hypothetical protein